MSIQTHKNEKNIENVLVGHGQKWVWPVWLWGSKIDFIEKINRCNKMIFCMLVQIQEN